MPAMSMLACTPETKDARCASIAPKTATAIVPPIWRLELSNPAARPACSAGSASSSTTVSAGSATPRPTPAGTSAAASSRRCGPLLTTGRTSIPSVLSARPALIGTFGPKRVAVLAEVRFATDSSPVIGRNSRPAATADRPSARWKNRLSTNSMP
jgi:hypothetical protein